MEEWVVQGSTGPLPGQCGFLGGQEGQNGCLTNT